MSCRSSDSYGGAHNMEMTSNGTHWTCRNKGCSHRTKVTQPKTKTVYDKKGKHVVPDVKINEWAGGSKGKTSTPRTTKKTKDGREVSTYATSSGCAAATVGLLGGVMALLYGAADVVWRLVA